MIFENFNTIPDLRYIAGLYDGDGTCGITHHGKNSAYYCTLSIAMTDAESVKALHNRFGGRLTSRKLMGNRRILFACIITGKEVSDVAQKLLPLISIKRRKKALKCVIELARTIGLSGNFRSTELRQYQKLLYQQCCEVNQHLVRKSSLDSTTDNLQLMFL